MIIPITADALALIGMILVTIVLAPGKLSKVFLALWLLWAAAYIAAGGQMVT